MACVLHIQSWAPMEGLENFDWTQGGWLGCTTSFCKCEISFKSCELWTGEMDQWLSVLSAL